MAFERFVETGRRTYTPKGTLTRFGMLGFNHAARQKFEIDKYGYCILLYDRASRRIGVLLTKDSKEDGAKKIRLRKTGADVPARAFVRHFGIDNSDTTICPISRDDETGYLVIDLNQGKKRARRA